MSLRVALARALTNKQDYTFYYQLLEVVDNYKDSHFNDVKFVSQFIKNYQEYRAALRALSIIMVGKDLK
jgi:valyl-tRNA synthetase